MYKNGNYILSRNAGKGVISLGRNYGLIEEPDAELIVGLEWVRLV